MKSPAEDKQPMITNSRLVTLLTMGSRRTDGPDCILAWHDRKRGPYKNPSRPAIWVSFGGKSQDIQQISRPFQDQLKTQKAT